MTIEFAVSPCPNDTFVFYPWVENRISSSFPLSLKMADIELLNEWALAERFPFIKASIALLPVLSKDYFLLPVGTALGYGCGPKIISNTPLEIADVANYKILVPGLNTTAHALLKALYPSMTNKQFCSYDSIFKKLKNGEANCGLIIHESRFTFQKEGFFEFDDLGKRWEEETGLPIPLGGFFAHRSLKNEIIRKVVDDLRQCLEFSWSNYDEVAPYMQQCSQEKDIDVIKQHVDIYVTKETHTLSSHGRTAIEKLTGVSLSGVLYE